MPEEIEGSPVYLGDETIIDTGGLREDIMLAERNDGLYGREEGIGELTHREIALYLYLRCEQVEHGDA